MFGHTFIAWLKSQRVRQLLFFFLFLTIWILISSWLSTWMMHPETPNEKLCRCRRNLPLVNSADTTSSWCSEDSLLRGNHQKVVAYSVYGNLSDNYTRQRYFSLLPVNAERIAKHYPGWIMRIHHKTKSSDTLSITALCQLFCSFPHVDLCDVSQQGSENPLLKQPAVSSTSLKGLHPFIWRFLPLLDDQVDMLMSRDTDSEINDREIQAVRQWITSKYTFHLMRDHPFQSYIMLGGLWGAKVHQRRKELLKAAQDMIISGQDSEYGSDQYALGEFVWPFARTDVMAHDSYFCNESEYNPTPAFPFPTQRNADKDFVGDVVTDSFRGDIEPCPLACRPKNHQDWEYC